MSSKPVTCKICNQNTHHHTLPHCHQCEERDADKEFEDRWYFELHYLSECQDAHDLRNWIKSNIKHILK